MKVLITGATGFIGSELTRRLVEEGKDEIGVIVRTASSKDHMYAISDFASRIQIYHANFTDWHAIKKAISDFSPNYIIHIGARTEVRHSFENPHEFNETNYLGTINLIHAALQVPDFKKFIFASSMEVYGYQPEKKPFKEKLPLHPGSPYSVSKAACEYYIEMAGKIYGLPYLISRACNTYGRRYNAGYIVEYIITSMIAGKDVYLGTPDAIRDLMYVDDHVNAYYTLLRSSVTNQTFNFGTGNQKVVREVAELIKNKLNFSGKIIEHWPPDYPHRPTAEEYLSVDASKAKKILNWEPKYSIEEGLDKTIEYWKNK
ncbi:hypothetical protein A3H65_04025 [Candidatus Giovannonibacteria bacterium RIFCSPLOWO2_02_FULL_45_14]|uniref:NAD(P)-binding domain-containing protein n=1 Tax=Candidatus Giovannonibacteria bacterium RIFCSPLOWO2_12_FULL_44_15 TaxID=1798364 RepID=A0A1F5Y0Y9_9BACT|nr:MAG: hypothetical protein A3C75_03225 [Candidatus Giovannonibacteria bacterium RIFCSPHIGHO2_02_FULL_44_31]OGF76656.1 MAG: hypothetical protein A3E62_03435 [Candidatus Giovannonibacteria bacterium RIFCSPHIGHO2_12_FULL_44_29]OGF91230.1 MAG: hypothetical protein A3H65_04025 [Candidatus Giovannonibacteria bacterium RIFCSPLOWO2_02_FULL_45_14]OGF93742.1 MAG: hypothetical protein A3G54_04295 [Candidatus Giovannonibacteria bacterium RIFCSPLOWO2_12_FULL_44_15]